jgi:ribose-phosphate pyrophosphokinase
MNALAQGFLLCFEDEARIASAAAQAAGMRLAVVERHRFPDGELRLRLPERLPERVVLWRGLQQPNEKIVELLLVARTARQLGAEHLSLIVPYLAYMRQDIAFNPGEVVSQRVLGAFLAELFDAVITVDPHLHRVATLQEAVPVPQAVVLSGAPLLADHVAACRVNPLLIGPDEEAEQWVSQAARRHDWDFAVCRKTRRGDRDVSVDLSGHDVRGRRVVLMDDVASSGHTLLQATRAVLQSGAESVDVAVTHALFADGAVQALHDAGVGEVWSTDCIAHSSNAVSIVPSVVAALKALVGNPTER